MASLGPFGKGNHCVRKRSTLSLLRARTNVSVNATRMARDTSKAQKSKYAAYIPLHVRTVHVRHPSSLERNQPGAMGVLLAEFNRTSVLPTLLDWSSENLLLSQHYVFIDLSLTIPNCEIGALETLSDIGLLKFRLVTPSSFFSSLPFKYYAMAHFTIRRISPCISGLLYLGNL
jgi:hypothetical protein